MLIEKIIHFKSKKATDLSMILNLISKASKLYCKRIPQINLMTESKSISFKNDDFFLEKTRFVFAFQKYF
jgi:hypothetical protein